MSALLALAAAACWGSSDFAAGYASRKSSAISVVILTHLTALVVLLFVALDFGPMWMTCGDVVRSLGPGTNGGPIRWSGPGIAGSPSASDLSWGLAAGLGGGLGAMLLFRGLGKGTMAIVAPITAAGAAAIPVIFGIVTGDPVTLFSVAGITLALVAIVLVSLSGGDEPSETTPLTVPEEWSIEYAPPSPSGFALDPRLEERPLAALAAQLLAQGSLGASPLTDALPPCGITPQPARNGSPWRAIVRQPGVPEALFSGVGFGLFFVFIYRAGEDAGQWPLVGARLVSVLLFGLIAVGTAKMLLPERGSRPPVVIAGVLDAAAAIFFVMSTRIGLLSVGAVLAALYPVATVVLARVITKERIRREQVAGLALALVAVGFLAV